MQTTDFIWFLCYVLVLVGLAGYGFHRLMIVCLYWKNVHRTPKPKSQFDELPVVTVQLPMYNEMFVVDRLLESIAALDYPQDKLEIQVLDDSTDGTTEICMQKTAELRERGFDAVCLHRTDRTGFKAGALEEATKVAKGEYLFILDADFQPEPDVLKQMIHYFTDDSVGLVQTRWGHINREFNLLTRVQGMFLDGHFVMEQTARNRSGRFFTFNGTAGMWRKSTIFDAGGWDHDTLTEDMDISYRAQMKGWHFVFLNDVVTPAELPVDMDGFKAQQHRWTKGSIQVCQKMLLDIWRSSAPLKAKMEATTHLTANYAYLLLVLLCVLIYPVAMGHFQPLTSSNYVLAMNVSLFFFASVAVCIFYVSAQIAIRPRTWWKELPFLPILLALGIGMAVNNAKAVLEAIFGHQSEFVRTPKYGIDQKLDKKAAKSRKNGYKAIKSVLIPVLELAFGIFFLMMISTMVIHGNFISAILMSPFLGFFYTSFCSIGKMISQISSGRKAPKFLEKS